MKKIKILFCIYYLRSGGAEKALITLLDKFDYTHYEVDLLLFKKEGLFLDQLNQNVTVRTIEGYEQLESTKSFLRYCLKRRDISSFVRILAAAIAHKAKGTNMDALNWRVRWEPHLSCLTGKYDVAVGYMHGLPTWYVVDKVDAPVKIGWVHNFYSNINRSAAFEFSFFEVCNYIVTVSKECKIDLQNHFPKLQDKIITLHNLMNIDAIREKAQVGPGYTDSFDGMRLLTIGSLAHQKGYDLAIAACRILKDRGYSFRWYALGDGKLKDEISTMIQKFDISDYFFLLGITANPYPFIQNADIYVQTSRYEGKSIAIDEAKLLHRPIVVTNFPSVRDQIKDGVSGYIADIRAEAIADGIERLMKMPALRESFRENLRREAEVLIEANNVELEKHYRVFMSENETPAC